MTNRAVTVSVAVIAAALVVISVVVVAWTCVGLR